MEGGQWPSGTFSSQLFRCVVASLKEGVSVLLSVGPSIRRSVCPSIGPARRILSEYSAMLKNSGLSIGMVSLCEQESRTWCE